jgi:hypothetical protein
LMKAVTDDKEPRNAPPEIGACVCDVSPTLLKKEFVSSLQFFASQRST